MFYTSHGFSHQFYIFQRLIKLKKDNGLLWYEKTALSPIKVLQTLVQLSGKQLLVVNMVVRVHSVWPARAVMYISP